LTKAEVQEEVEEIAKRYKSIKWFSCHCWEARPI